jgi:hypothetical protein
MKAKRSVWVLLTVAFGLFVLRWHYYFFSAYGKIQDEFDDWGDDADEER